MPREPAGTEGGWKAGWTAAWSEGGWTAALFAVVAFASAVLVDLALVTGSLGYFFVLAFFVQGFLVVVGLMAAVLATVGYLLKPTRKVRTLLAVVLVLAVVAFIPTLVLWF